MPYTQEQINEMATLYREIESRKTHEYAAPTYRDSQALARLSELASSCEGGDADAAEDKIAVYAYLATSYDGMGRTALSVMCYMALLKAYATLHTLCDKQKEAMEDFLYQAFAARNFYAPDKCEDLIVVASKHIQPKRATEILAKVQERSRTRLKHDPVELTTAYLSVIDEVEQRIEEEIGPNRGMGYCYMYWSRKAEMLAQYGIEWKSPSVLNPHVRFD